MEGQLIGKYRIVRRLGEGGMGMVFEAVRDDIGTRAAIKVLRPEVALNAEIATRFFNEARAANKIDHPGIVRVFDYECMPHGLAYLAMEYLDGQPLNKRLEKLGRIPVPDALHIGWQMAAALAAAHARHVIHRDLKPANVMLVADPVFAGGERVKILDFGIAKLAEPGGAQNVRTRTGMVMGTPAYMSPEQCRGVGSVDDKSDVYSLGVMLFHMLAGSPPFVAAGDGELFAMHLFTEPPSMASRCPDAPDELVRYVHAMLSKDPGARPSMTQIAATLQRLGEQMPGGPVPRQPAPSMSWRQLMLAGTVLLLLASILGVTRYLRVRGHSMADSSGRGAPQWTAPVEKARPTSNSQPFADRAQQGEHSYRLLVAAAAAKDPDAVIESYSSIPTDSSYYAAARKTYYDFLPAFEARHFARAEAARRSGDCSESKEELFKLLKYSPGHFRARQQLLQACSKPN